MNKTFVLFVQFLCCLLKTHFYLSSETCRCTEYLSVSLVPSPLDTSELNSLSTIIGDLVTSTCGRCREHTEDDTTKLTPGDNQTQDPPVTFPVTLTKPYGNTAYSKFVPIISVPGVVIVKRKSIDNSGLLTKVAANSVFEAWPVCVITLVIALLAGIIVWILVRFLLGLSDLQLSNEPIENSNAHHSSPDRAESRKAHACCATAEKIATSVFVLKGPPSPKRPCDRLLLFSNGSIVFLAI